MTLRNLRLEPRHVRTLIIAAQSMQEKLGTSTLDKIVSAELTDALDVLERQAPADWELVASINRSTR